MASAVEFLGTSDEVNTCDCCGKSKLKSTVAISIDGGEAVYYGVVCAARALGRSAKEVRQGTKRADDAARERRAAVERAYDRECDARLTAFLDARVPHLKGKRLDQNMADRSALPAFRLEEAPRRAAFYAAAGIPLS